jgi:hypothetical protein
MYRKNNSITNKTKIIVLLIIIINMTLALGILIGQRNLFNTSFAGSLSQKTESGLTKNILSELNEKTIFALGKEPVEAGVFRYIKWNNKIEYSLNIQSPINELIFGKEKKAFPTKYSIESITYNQDQSDVVYTKIGELEMEKNGKGAKAVFYGEITENTLQIKQLVLKALDNNENQNFYLYSDKNLPEKLLNRPMPYFWIVL